MAVVYAPKTDLVGRGVSGVSATVLDNLLRAHLDAWGQIDADGRVQQLAADLTGEGALSESSLTADRLLVSIDEQAIALTGESAVTSARPRNDDTRADLTGDLLFISEPTRSHLSGSGEVEAVLTGGQGVVFVSRDLSGSGTLTAVTEAITHEVSADIAATGRLAVIGETDIPLTTNPIALVGDSAIAADFDLLPGFESRVTQLTGESGVSARLRKAIPIRVRMIANGVLAEPRKTVFAVATIEQTSSVSTETETLTVEESGPHTYGLPPSRTAQGKDALDIQPSVNLLVLNEPAVGLGPAPLAVDFIISEVVPAENDLVQPTYAPDLAVGALSRTSVDGENELVQPTYSDGLAIAGISLTSVPGENELVQPQYI